MIMPTLVSVRKNSSSSSIAIRGAGILPFMTPVSMIGRGSTWPSIWPGGDEFGSGVRPTAALGSVSELKIDGGWVPGRPFWMSFRPESGPNENM